VTLTEGWKNYSQSLEMKFLIFVVGDSVFDKNGSGSEVRVECEGNVT